MTTVIGYVRVSTSDQNVENQKKQIADAGYSVTRWFSDEAVSGAIKAGVIRHEINEGGSVR